MFVVHTGFNSPDGPAYIIAGVFSTHQQAFDCAKNLAGRFGQIDEGDVIIQTPSGFTIEAVGAHGEPEEFFINVDPIELNGTDTDNELGSQF